FAIRRKVGYITLLTHDYQHQVIDWIHGQGLWVLANLQPVAYSFNKESWPRFTETDMIPNVFRAHLYSPLAYSYRFQQYTVQSLRDRLDFGLLYCVVSPENKLDIVSKFFPITPLELHRGWVKGEERVVTDRSGQFGWEGQKYQMRLWRY